MKLRCGRRNAFVFFKGYRFFSHLCLPRTSVVCFKHKHGVHSLVNWTIVKCSGFVINQIWICLKTYDRMKRRSREKVSWVNVAPVTVV